MFAVITLQHYIEDTMYTFLDNEYFKITENLKKRHFGPDRFNQTSRISSPCEALFLRGLALWGLTLAIMTYVSINRKPQNKCN